jgi:hypothetical protein
MLVPTKTGFLRTVYRKEVTTVIRPKVVNTTFALSYIGICITRKFKEISVVCRTQVNA